MSIVFEEVVKKYGEQLAVDHVSFEVKKGEITGFLGPNGAGKSTSMKIATGYIPATEGEVVVVGKKVSEDAFDIKKRVGYLPEHNPLYLEMYVKEYLGFISGAYGIRGKERKSRIQEIIGLCGLEREQHKRIKALSKGYRQRVGLAQALLPNPEVLILDEPTTGLDPNQIVEIRNVIKQISQDKTVILSTHIMQEVEAICDKAVIINKGKIVADNTLAELKSKSKQSTRIKIDFESVVDESLFEGLAEFISIQNVGGSSYEIESGSDSLKSDVLKVVTKHDLPLQSIQAVGSSLEEIFQSLTQTND